MSRNDDISRLRHDLRTPLTVVAGFGELLAGDQPLTEEQRRQFADRIVAAAEEMREILASTEER
jgi:signal transduction histidine kinase